MQLTANNASMDDLTLDQLKGSLPAKLRKNVTEDMVTLVNSEQDSDFREHYRNNVISYTSVLQGGKFKLVDYINAV